MMSKDVNVTKVQELLKKASELEQGNKGKDAKQEYLNDKFLFIRRRTNSIDKLFKRGKNISKIILLI